MIRFESKYLYAAWDPTLVGQIVIAGDNLYDDIIDVLRNVDYINNNTTKVTGENECSNYPFNCGDASHRYVYADPHLPYKIARELGKTLEFFNPNTDRTITIRPTDNEPDWDLFPYYFFKIVDNTEEDTVDNTEEDTVDNTEGYPKVGSVWKRGNLTALVTVVDMDYSSPIQIAGQWLDLEAFHEEWEAFHE